MEWGRKENKIGCVYVCAWVRDIQRDGVNSIYKSKRKNSKSEHSSQLSTKQIINREIISWEIIVINKFRAFFHTHKNMVCCFLNSALTKLRIGLKYRIETNTKNIRA